MSNIEIVRKNLGPVTAYKYAVQQGYTGTEQEFAALMASYATVAETAEAAKDDAVDAKTAAEAAQAAAEAAQAAAEAAAEQAEGAIEVDGTLSIEGRAADAKVTGDRIGNVEEELEPIIVTVNGIHNAVELYNISENTPNKCLRSDGTIRATNDYVYTGYMPVDSAYHYEYTGLLIPHNYAYTCFYDENKTLLPDYSVNLLNNTSPTAQTKVYPLTIPEAAKYVRFSLYIGGVSLGADAFSFKRLQDQNGLVDDVGFLKVVDVLRDKKVLFFGDSICNGSSAGDGLDGYAGRIGRAFGMDWINYGYNGATITSVSGHHNISGDVITAITQHPDADYIILEGGTNDADNLHSEGLGTFSANDYSGNYDTTTFSGAFETMLYNVVSSWKTAQIGYIVAHKMGTGQTGRDRRYEFFQRAMDLCNKWGVPVLNMWDGTKLNPTISTHYDNTKTAQENIDAENLYTDGQHLTPTGYATILPYITGWMRTL